jgi:hypothetical protein
VADSGALRVRRARLHARGEHELCRESSSCRRPLRVAVAGDPPGGLVGAVAAELAEADPVVRELGLRLADIAAEGRGPAQVNALRALGELLAEQR